ncbi:MAG TPA: cupin domain-containing protein [Segetibacter sp.]|jgi:mannose-6-phosphate isomerase-like protein (cupin superfamily)
MNDSTKILPGDIESYCLGLLSEEENRAVAEQAALHADIKEQIDEFRSLLEHYALSNAIQPPIDLKNKILTSLSNLKLEEAANIDLLPLVNKYSDHNNWLKIVQPLLPEEQPTGMFVKELRNDNHVTQILMWAAIDYPDEVHHDEEECFIVLMGKCRCYIGDKSVILSAGDFVEIPLHVHHNVEVLEPVIAIVQRKKVA